jgi:hypothetical protein
MTGAETLGRVLQVRDHAVVVVDGGSAPPPPLVGVDLEAGVLPAWRRWNSLGLQATRLPLPNRPHLIAPDPIGQIWWWVGAVPPEARALGTPWPLADSAGWPPPVDDALATAIAQWLQARGFPLARTRGRLRGFGRRA